MLIQCFHYLRAFLIIYLSLLTGQGIAALLPIAIPASICGMLVLFLLLTINIIPVSWVQPGCSLLIRYMAMLFVPIAVGIMNYYEPISQQLNPIVTSCIVSSLITLFVVGFSAQLLYKDKE